MNPTEVLPEVTFVYPFGEAVPKGKRICVDLDGVICGYDFPRIVKDYFGVSLDPQSIFAYDLADVLGVSPEEIHHMFEEQIYSAPNFVKGAWETLREWQAKGYELSIFSNRGEYMGQEEFREWLTRWFIPFDYLTIGYEEYDVHIDDSPSKLMATDSRLKLLFDRPWNQRCLNITGRIERVYNWGDIKKKVSELSSL